MKFHNLDQEATEDTLQPLVKHVSKVLEPYEDIGGISLIIWTDKSTIHSTTLGAHRHFALLERNIAQYRAQTAFKIDPVQLTLYTIFIAFITYMLTWTYLN